MTVAFADPGPLLVGEVALDPAEAAQAVFVVDRKLGRVWVQARVDDGEIPRVVDLAVPALSLGPEGLTVAGDAPWSCGKVAAGARSTRAGCRLVVTTEVREEDDGLRVHRQLYAVVALERAEP